MDPAIMDISTKVLAVLLPFVTKGAEAFANKAGDAAYDKVSALLSLLKKKWSRDPVAAADLARFEKNPEAYQEALKQTLLEKLTEDKELASQVSQFLQEMGPSLESFQKMDEGEGVTGVEVDEIHRGKVKSRQDIKRGKDITGIRAKDVG